MLTVRGIDGNWLEISSIYYNIVKMLVHLHKHLLELEDTEKHMLREYLYKENPKLKDTVTVMKPIGTNVAINEEFNEFSITQIGGRPTKPTHLIYKLNNKQYKIRQDGRKRFILVKKEPIYLKDIPGKYSFIKTT